MHLYSIVAQIIVALSIGYVWIFRLGNVEKEFHEYGLNDLIRNLVGASKIALSTLLVAGIWYPSLILIPALLLAFLMVCAQYFHFRCRHSLQKHLPSLILLFFCLLIAAIALKLV